MGATVENDRAGNWGLGSRGRISSGSGQQPWVAVYSHRLNVVTSFYEWDCYGINFFF